MVKTKHRVTSVLLTLCLTVVMLAGILIAAPVQVKAATHTWDSITVPTVADNDTVTLTSSARGELEVPDTVNTLTITGGASLVTVSNDLSITILTRTTPITLNLDNVSFRGNDPFYSAIYSLSSTTTTLNISNTVNLSGSGNGSALSFFSSSLIITGTGTLTATAGGREFYAALGAGITVGGNLTIDSGVTVIAKGSENTEAGSNGGFGLRMNKGGTLTNYGNLTAIGANGGTDTGSGGKNGGEGIIFLGAGTLVNNGTIIATGGNGSSATSGNGNGGNGGDGIDFRQGGSTTGATATTTGGTAGTGFGSGVAGTPGVGIYGTVTPTPSADVGTDAYYQRHYNFWVPVLAQLDALGNNGTLTVDTTGQDLDHIMSCVFGKLENTNRVLKVKHQGSTYTIRGGPDKESWMNGILLGHNHAFSILGAYRA